MLKEKLDTSRAFSMQLGKNIMMIKLNTNI